MKKIVLCLLVTNVIISVMGQDGPSLKQQLSSVSSTLKNIWDGGKQFVSGMGQSFGFVSSEYIYNCIVFNDAPQAIFVGMQHITGFMGAKFSGDIVTKMTLAANENSGDTFKKQQLYASVWLCGEKNELTTYAQSASEGAVWGSVVPLAGTALGGIIGGMVTTAKLEDYKIYSRDLSLGKKNDPNIYYYRTYTYQGNVHGEYLGVKANSTDFAGVFFNNTNEASIFFMFTKDGATYIVNLEPNSYNMLQSTQGITGSIRSTTDTKRAFQFYNSSTKEFTDATSIAYIPLSEVGIANISIDPSTKVQTTAGPMTITYEVHTVGSQLTVGTQGLAVGHYDQPCSAPCATGQANSLVRDINPVQCHVWRTSAAEMVAAAQKEQAVDYSTTYYDTPDQVWISYITEDSVYQQKITAGAVLDVNFIRPRLSEKEAYLYIVSLKTADDDQAKKFLNRLHAGTIGKGAVYTTVTASQIQQFVAGQTDLLVSPQPNTNGVIDDIDTSKDPSASGIKGEILLADSFTSRGVGVGPFYYSVGPASLPLSSLTAGLYLDDANYNTDRSLKSTVLQDLATKIIAWITAYVTNKNAVRTEVITYVQQHGSKHLFTNSKDIGSQRNLSSAGTQMLNSFLEGPISIQNPPLVQKAGKNYYVYGLGAVPGNWPAQAK